jgi:D-aminoacyl-tRNA deacylase
VILLVASNKDVASLNIKMQVLSHYPFREVAEGHQGNPAYEANIRGRNVKLITLDEESVRAQNLLESFQGVELVVFISRHSSLSGTPTLSVHTPGNLDEAELGGLARVVSVSPANAMRDALRAMVRLKEELQLGYDVCYEGTHHGPSLNAPTMFAELGSSPTQWNDTKAAEAVAHAAIEAISNFGTSHAKVVLGIGGTHYNSKFTRIALESDTAFSHMIPKYALPYANVQTLKQCVERTLEKVDRAVLDWKGIKGENKRPLLAMLEDVGLEYEKV